MLVLEAEDNSRIRYADARNQVAGAPKKFFP
jgi:hypothetical protein